MWVVTHTFVGLALGVALYAVLGLPYWVVVVLILVSHVLLDLIPHWDYVFTSREILWGCADFSSALATCLVLLALGAPFALVLLGPVSGAPDFDVLVRTLRGKRGRYWFPSHWDGFPHGACGPVFGIGVQAALILASGAIFAGVYW